MKTNFYRPLALLPAVFFVIRLNSRFITPLVENSLEGQERAIACAFLDTFEAVLLLSFGMLACSVFLRIVAKIEKGCNGDEDGR